MEKWSFSEKFSADNHFMVNYTLWPLSTIKYHSYYILCLINIILLDCIAYVIIFFVVIFYYFDMWIKALWIACKFYMICVYTCGKSKISRITRFFSLSIFLQIFVPKEENNEVNNAFSWNIFKLDYKKLSQNEIFNLASLLLIFLLFFCYSFRL